MRTLLAVAVLALAPVQARVSLPSWFGDHMVLQTNSEYGARAFLNGRADPGERVTVSVSGGMSHFGGEYATTADPSGRWTVQLNPSSSHSPCNISVRGASGSPAVEARQVHFGDVFFCSGQSNMVFPLDLAYNASLEAKTLARFPNFRFFMTGRAFADQPQFDFATNTSCDADRPADCNRWLTAAEAANGFINKFSAVCFMTVRDIAQMHTRDRPTALIQSAWGGTRVEAWMSKEAIAGTGSFGKVVPARAGQNSATVLYNAMIAPWNQFAVRAALWYQGEANADQKIEGIDQTEYYAVMLQAMIKDWRSRKAMGDFGFVTMQLPPSVPVRLLLSQVEPSAGRYELRCADGHRQVFVLADWKV